MKKSEEDLNEDNQFKMGDSLTANPITPYHSKNDTASDMASSSTIQFNDNPRVDFDDESSYSSGESDEEYEDGDDGEEAPLSLEEVLYSANSYNAIVRPVSATMILAALASVYVNNDASREMGEQQFSSAYNVWQLDGNSSVGKNLAMSIANTLVMVSVIGAMTFGIVLLYKYRCMKCLIGYMIMSSASLLGLLGHEMGFIAIQIYNIPIDALSYTLLMYNFAIVGVIAIFYQKGIPNSITQGYLVCTSVILAWHLSHFDDWTAWTLLVMLAFYDLCAVLTPCGPLKALVNLMQDEDAPDMPGLLYEAHLPAGTQKPGRKKSQNNGRADESTDNSRSSEGATATSQSTSRRESRREGNRSGSNDSAQLPPPLKTPEETDPATALGDGPRVYLPLAIAKVYRLPLVSRYTHAVSTSNSTSGRHRKRSRRRKQNSSINESPLLAENANGESLDEFYQRKFSASELIAEVEVELPRNGGKIEKFESGNRYAVIGKNGEVKRELFMNKKGKVFDVTDDEDDESVFEDDPSSIRLGLGDFIFYSVLVSKAALYSFTTFAACMLVILAGLGATLVFLSVYHSALPALPISIFLGVIFYLLTRLLIEPWVEHVLTVPVYV